MNYKILIQFDGTRYLGWQKQKTGVQTIQGKIETILKKLFDEEIQTIGCSRTDSGVHAITYTANFKASDIEVEKLKKYFKEYLPEDIVIKDIQKVNDRFHARYNAKSKSYIYKIDNSLYGDVFQKKYAWHINRKLDIQKMIDVSKYLIGTHDFKAFTNKSKNKNTVRTINDIKIYKENHNIIIQVTGESFLLNMVRIIVGTLVEFGENSNKQIEDIIRILELKDRNLAGERALAKGLYLLETYY
ncbi:MAG: tRNA pseudouridine(38-40) synthase TruA [Sarcina sp.]